MSACVRCAQFWIVVDQLEKLVGQERLKRDGLEAKFDALRAERDAAVATLNEWKGTFASSHEFVQASEYFDGKDAGKDVVETAMRYAERYKSERDALRAVAEKLHAVVWAKGAWTDAEVDALAAYDKVCHAAAFVRRVRATQ